MLCPEERLWTPGLNCQLHFYLRLLCFLCPCCAPRCRAAYNQPSSTRSPTGWCGVPAPSPWGLRGCDPCSTAPLSSQLGPGPQEGAHSLRLRVYGVHGCTCMWCVCVPPALSTAGDLRR